MQAIALVSHVNPHPGSGSCSRRGRQKGRDSRHRLARRERSPSTASPSSKRRCATSTSRPRWSRAWARRRTGRQSMQRCSRPRRSRRRSRRTGTPALGRAAHRRRTQERTPADGATLDELLERIKARVDKARPDPRRGGGARAGGVENRGRLDRGELNDRARPAFSLSPLRVSLAARVCACEGRWCGLGDDDLWGPGHRSNAWAAPARGSSGIAKHLKVLRYRIWSLPMRNFTN